MYAKIFSRYGAVNARAAKALATQGLPQTPSNRHPMAEEERRQPPSADEKPPHT